MSLPTKRLETYDEMAAALKLCIAQADGPANAAVKAALEWQLAHLHELFPRPTDTGRWVNAAEVKP